MRIIALHTDFRIYWPARLKALQTLLEQRGDTLIVVEITGKGSPYAFAGKKKADLDWNILFPEDSPEQLNPAVIKQKLFRLLESIKPDVILAGAIAFPSGALAVQWGLNRGVKVISFDDAKCEAVKRNRIVEGIKKAIYSGVDAMLYPAPDWLQTGRYWGFDAEQMFYGVDVVDNTFWGVPAKEVNHWGSYFVAVGRQIEKKNHLTIAKAYSKYRHTLGEDAYDLVLIGEGPEHDKIAQYVSDAHLEKHIHLLPFLTQEELPAIYQHARALISSSSSSETWGLVINEAMAGGCPIIASVECGATNTLVHDDVNGYRFTCNDQDRLAELMVKFHQLGCTKQKEMGESSKRIIADWGLDRFARGCVDAIDFVVNQPKRKGNILQKQIIKLWKGQYRPV